MNHDRIVIDEALLRRNLAAFLRSPTAKPVLEELDTPWWLCLIGAGILTVAGLVMLPTIVGTRKGLQMLGSVARLEQFSVLPQNPSRNPDAVHPLIAHGVIIGPDQKHALAMGTFRSSSEYSVDWLAQQAARFAEIYLMGPDQPEEGPLDELLQDDTYHAYRRRPVPEPFSGGADLVLFDVEVTPHEGRATPYDTTLFAFAAVPGDSGPIALLPWSVVEDAVRIDGA